MKKTVRRLLPFICIFVLATGSVVLSCATAPGAQTGSDGTKLSINTGKTDSGKIYTTWVFSEIQSVLIISAADRSRKIELSPGEWRYDPATTELVIFREIPFADYGVHIEGHNTMPHTFVLNDIKPDSDLMVIYNDRLAIDGYDYNFTATGNRLVFRKDINLNNAQWFIQYTTQYGISSFGDWKPENQDRMSYIEAEFRKRSLDAWYDKQEAFWFFGKSASDPQSGQADQNGQPRLVRRKATAEELQTMKSYPVSVLKFRTETKSALLSKELGFDATLPETIHIPASNETMRLSGKIIEEYAQDGNLVRDLCAMYETGNTTIDIVITPSSVAGHAQESPEWPIDEETIDLGLPVKQLRHWSMETRDLDAKPEMVRTSSWVWTDGKVTLTVAANSSDEDRCQSMIRQTIALRQKSGR